MRIVAFPALTGLVSFGVTPTTFSLCQLATAIEAINMAAIAMATDQYRYQSYGTAAHNDHSIPSLEGHSLASVFTDDELPERPIFWEHEGNAAVRVGKWKLVRAYPDPWELYDMNADRTEMNNLAAQFPDVVSQYTEQYDQWAKRCGVIPREKILDMMKELPGTAFWEEED